MTLLKTTARFSWLLLIASALATAPACGSNNGAGGDGDGDGGVGDGDGDGDGDGGVTDGGVQPGCTPGLTECSNCIDDDGDGDIDGADIHCTSLADDRELDFATGISGDNKDAVNQDCFFDGDSGDGNDGCNRHICCLLGATTSQECRDFADQYGITGNINGFDPNECNNVSQMCIDVCGAITPPGCDCFGCCTLCNGTDCRDVSTNPITAPNCTKDNLDDVTECPPCTKVDTCDNPCDADPCVLCPGQTEEDLPPECGGMNTCENDYTPCETTDDCATGEFCTVGCCIPQID